MGRASRLAAVLLLGLLAACTPYYEGQRADYAQDWDLAVSAYTRELERDPGSIRARRALGKAYFMKQDYAASRATFDELLTVAPDDWQGVFFLGLIDVAEGRRAPGVSRMRSVNVPGKYPLTAELVCSVDRVAGMNLPDNETVERILEFLKECQRRQDFRDRRQGSEFLDDHDLDLPIECPPMLDRVLYFF